MDSSLQADIVFESGRGAIIVATFGAVWLCWGLLIASALTLPRGIVLGVIELVLLSISLRFVRKGKELRALYRPSRRRSSTVSAANGS